MARGLVGSRRRYPRRWRVPEWARAVGGGGEPPLGADLAHRRRVAPRAHVLLDHLEDRQLAVGEVLVGHAPPPNRCLDEGTVARRSGQGKHLFVWVLTTNGRSWLPTNRGSISEESSTH